MNNDEDTNGDDNNNNSCNNMTIIPINNSPNICLLQAVMCLAIVQNLFIEPKLKPNLNLIKKVKISRRSKCSYLEF